MRPLKAGRRTAGWRSRWCRSPWGSLTISDRYEKQDTGRWIEDTGFVKKLIPDDNDGARHQRFILDMANRQTLLIAHNIDLAERVPVAIGERISFRGMYEWNELGGLVHWTHDDPMGVEEGGWVRYRRNVYR
ncbi:MAG: DUF3465 domain-containing protein [Woeseiaceae bacterium]|nr:DUF3465 domain-containing protein [Woeseiaceae bacterium]NIP21403.1 DUF3465 domain-containing protein [Woeseiaceae bacterium]